MRFLNISCEAETHTIPKPQNEKTLTLWDWYGKSQTIPKFCYTLQI